MKVLVIYCHPSNNSFTYEVKNEFIRGLHDGNHEIYESVRPGITGWWACNGRSATTYAERLELEYYYVKNKSLWLDIKCVFKTISAVLTNA